MKRLRPLLLTSTALIPLAAWPALGDPLGGDVVAGAASIAGTGTGIVTVTQSTDKAIINWNTFDIGAGEVTTFVQPDASSVVLNRVTGGLGPSQIIGTLVANGQVYLVNRDGILFGKDAVIDTGALVATTHDILDQDFLNGNYRFDIPGNPSASVVNLGVITVEEGGFAALVAPGVRNDGVITARLGKIGLASGNGFSLDLYGDSLINLAVSDETSGEIIDVATGETLKTLVSSGGRLSADGGIVQLTAASTRAVVDAVINNTGNIEANSVGLENGKIVLSAATSDTKGAGAPTQKVRVSGTLSAVGSEAGEIGGAVEITGEDIQLFVATIDAFGWNGGGTVLVGGDVGGGSPNRTVVSEAEVALADQPIANATTVNVDEGSVIDASATALGDGGKVIVWADGTTSYAGSIVAKGGDQGGDGGFVETSGHEALEFTGVADTSAPQGANGTLLLDPLNVTIGTTGAHTITPAAIVTALASNNVKVTTGSAGSEAGDITVAEALSWNTANALTLSAARDVIVNAAITNTAGADIKLRADDTGIGIGTVSFGATGSVTTTGAVSLYYNPEFYYSPNDPQYQLHVASSSFEAFMLVNSATQLQEISQNPDGSYALGRDIVASDTATWNGGLGFLPIGYNPSAGNVSPAQFSGHLDGLGHTITGLTISNLGADNLGLFSLIGSTGIVENLTMAGGTVTAGVGHQAVGALAGKNSGTIRNVSASTAVVGANGSQKVGGLVGWNWNGSIVDSSATGNVTAGDGASDIGGLVGLTGFQGGGSITGSHASGNVTVGLSATNVGGLIGNNNGGQISKSYAEGDVTAGTGSNSIGGLAGGNSGYFGGGQISESFAIGGVNGGSTSVYVGGLVGANIWGASVSDSYANGSVTGGSYIGGLVGWNGYTNLGQPISATITTSYAAGAVSGTSNVGALLGFNNGSVVTYSYWDSDAAGTPIGLGGSANGGTWQGYGLVVGNLGPSGLPNGFSESVWGAGTAGNNYHPYLLWETETGPGPTSETLLQPDEVTSPPGTSLPSWFSKFATGQVQQLTDTGGSSDIWGPHARSTDPYPKGPPSGAQGNTAPGRQSEPTVPPSNALWQRLMANGGLPEIEASDYSVATGISCVNYVKLVYSWIPWKSVGSAANWLRLEKADDDQTVTGFGLDFVTTETLAQGRSSYAAGLQVGDILIWGDDFYAEGHVAIVTSINGTKITVSQRNYIGPEYDSYTYDVNDSSNYAKTVAGVLRP